MIEKLACRLGRNDEIPNIELAEALCQNEDLGGIAEIVAGLKDRDKAVAHDCIKVLYEIGARSPQLIANHADAFLALLDSRNNRLVWGGMTALATIAESAATVIYAKIDRVLAVFREGSVIAVDNSVTVLAKLCKAAPAYEAHLFPLLLEHLQSCRTKEVPQHAERIFVCVNKNNANAFLSVLASRKADMDGSRLARVKKLEKKVGR